MALTSQIQCGLLLLSYFNFNLLYVSLIMYVCMHVCVCMCVCTYVRVWIFICMCVVCVCVGADFAEDTEDEEDDFPSIFEKQNYDSYVHPEDLPKDATATEVVRAWAARLQDVYFQCFPETIENASNYDDGADGVIDWAEELARVYRVMGMPEKISSINQILDIWTGKEDQMIRSLMQKYQQTMPPECIFHCNRILEQHDRNVNGLGVVGGGPVPASAPSFPNE